MTLRIDEWPRARAAAARRWRGRLAGCRAGRRGAGDGQAGCCGDLAGTHGTHRDRYLPGSSGTSSDAIGPSVTSRPLE